MKLRSLFAAIALLALALVPQRAAFAASGYTVRQLDANAVGVLASSAYFLSDNGVVAGYADLQSGLEQAFAWSEQTGFVPLTFGGRFMSGTSISRNGTVIGFGLTPGDVEVRGFVWTTSGGLVEIGSLGGARTFPRAVNDNGVVVGEAVTAYGESHAFVWTSAAGIVDIGSPGSESEARFVSEGGLVGGRVSTPAGTRVFVWTEADGMTNIGTIGGDAMHITRMNAKGAIAGLGTVASGGYHSFFWSPAIGLRDIATFGGNESDVFAMSQNNMVVGYSTTAAGDPRAYAWTPSSGVIDIGTLGGTASYALSVNDGGLVTGYSWTLGNPTAQGFLWSAATGIIDLGSLGAYSVGLKVTETGTVLGVFGTQGGAGTRVFAWTPATGLVDVGGIGDVAQFINANSTGAFVGASGATNNRSDLHAVLWTPERYQFGGFLQPIDRLPAINTVQAGASVPVNFKLGGDKGLDIFTPGYPSSRAVSCAAGAPEVPLEQTASPGGSTLSYDTRTGIYTYVWRTQKAWTGCRELTVTFTDGTTQSAMFRFK